jgi:hypothetical protein
MNEAIAPPLSELPQKQISGYKVTNVMADQLPELPVQPTVPELPKELSNIEKVINTGGTNQERMSAASHITQLNNETKDFHPNMQPQWGGVVASLLSRNYLGALRYYNGGPIVEESAKDVNGNEYYKSYNMNGDINVVKDKTGRELTPKEKQDLIAKGGLVSKSDRDAMLGINWKNPQANAEMARLGLASTLNTAYINANNAAQTANSSNGNLDEQIALGKKIPKVLDYISTLPKEQRSKILGIVNQYNTVSSQAAKQKESALGANASQNQQVGGTLNANVGGQGPGGIVSGGISAGASTTAGTNVGANARATEGATSSAGNTLQVQQNLERALIQELSGTVSPEELRDLFRIQALNTKNQEDYASIPKEAQPPGWENIPETDVLAGGRNAMLVNRVTQQKNNALMAEWNKEVYRAQQKASRSGEQIDVNDLRDKFSKSDFYKAVNNTYLNKLDYHITGEAKKPSKGSLIVDSKNKIHIVE